MCLSILTHLILSVVIVVPNKQVIRINASWVIASVANAKQIAFNLVPIS